MSYIVETPILYTVNHDDTKETLTVRFQRKFIDPHGIIRFHLVTVFVIRITDHESDTKDVSYSYSSTCVDQIDSQFVTILRRCAESCCKQVAPPIIEFDNARMFHEYIAKSQSPPFIQSNISIVCKEPNWHNSATFNSVKVVEVKYKTCSRIIMNDMLKHIDDEYSLPNLIGTGIASALTKRLSASLESLSGKG